MKKSLLKLSLVLSCFVLFISCNQNTTSKNKEVIKLRKKKSKEEKEKKAKGYADYIKSITTPMGEKESGYTSEHFYKEFEKSRVQKKEFLAQKNAKLGKNPFEAFTNDITWKEIGPANVPGRLRQIAIHPLNNKIWYIGTAGGGVWKTEDAGTTFRNLTDFIIPNLATSTVVLSPANPSVIYAGTGEPFNGVGMIGGIGITKSTDNGENWTILASTTAFGDVARMTIDPSNENIVIAATTSGIYKTTNGGDDWVRTYSEGGLQDLKSAPTDPNTIYAFDSTNKTLIKSTDQGDNWVTVYTPTIEDSRIELAISHQDPNKVYGSVYTGNQRDELITSIDGGQTWNIATENAENLSNFSNLSEYMGGQGWYDNTINIHPTDDNIVYLGGTFLFKSIVTNNNGVFEKLTTPMTDNYGSYFPATGKNLNVHPDQHTIEYIYGNNNEFQLIVGNDGGIAISNMSTDPGFNEGNWITGQVTGLNNTQFYGADKRNGTNQYIAGAQDNGTFVSTVNPGKTSPYNDVIGGDGFECVWNYTDPNKVLGASQNNGLSISSDGGANFTRSAAIRTGGPFISRFANAKNNPDVVYALNGEQGIYKSIDFGQSWEVKTVPYVIGGANGDLAVSTADPSIVWVGKASGTLSSGTSIPLFVSTDEGESFTSVTPNYTGLAFISGIETHTTDKNTAYLLMSLQGHSKIMRTEDLGQTWADITGFVGDGSPSTNGFPDVPVHALLTFPDTEVIWVGTDIGIFQSLNNGESWEYLDANIPAVSVWDMKIVNDQVVISTYGRGLWTATIPELANYELPTYTVPPKIAKATQTWRNNSVSLTYNLPSIYDETKIFVNDIEVKNLGSNDVPNTDLNAIIDLSDYSPEIDIKIISMKDGTTKTSKIFTLPLIDFSTTTDEYINQFEESLEGLSFFYEDPSIDAKGFGLFNLGWSTGNFILNSDVPYSDDSQYVFMPNKPIYVKGDETSTITFQNMAIVEPGDGTNLWDYVVVEATKDGENWIELTDRYDANSDSNWLNSFNTGALPLEEHYIKHEINLNDSFVKDDVILIRFRLEADAGVNSYGWFIDDIRIQETPKDIADLTPTVLNIENTTLTENIPEFFTLTVKNQGVQDSPETTATLYYSTKSFYDNTAIIIGSYTVPSITIGSEETISDKFKIQNLSDNGDYYIHCQVDSGNILPEILESNNFINQTITLFKSISSDNFIIKIEDETCEDQNNGSINITAKEQNNYTYTVATENNSEDGLFTEVLSLDNLSAGNYNLCIGMEGNSYYKQCYDLVINEPSNLFINTEVNTSSRTVTVNIEGGTAPYTVNLNGRDYSTNTNSIKLPILKGDNRISVSSKIVCEGTAVDIISSENVTLKAYPNPVVNQLFVTIPSSYTLEQIPVQVYTANGKLVLTNFYAIIDGKITINTTILGSGLYFVKIGTLDSIKIIKK